MAEKECSRCIHHPVCKTAESCDGYVSGCEHFKEQKQVRTDVREKLVELVHNARMNALWHNAQKPNEYITDMLMEDGVTVQEWISVKDRLPEKDGEYLVRFVNKEIQNAEYESKCGGFGNWLAIMWDEDADWFPYAGITHWMPLPKPPKGE